MKLDFRHQGFKWLENRNSALTWFSVYFPFITRERQKQKKMRRRERQKKMRFSFNETIYTVGFEDMRLKAYTKIFALFVDTFPWWTFWWDKIETYKNCNEFSSVSVVAYFKENNAHGDNKAETLRKRFRKKERQQAKTK